MVFWPFSKKKIAKLLKKSERFLNKWSKVKTLEDKPRSRWPSFHKLCEKYYRKICKYTRDNSPSRKVKKFQLHIIDQSFGHNGIGISYQKKLESLEEKKVVCTSCRHGSEGFANFIPKEERPANSCDVNPLETIWIIVDETTYKDPAPKPLDELTQ